MKIATPGRIARKPFELKRLRILARKAAQQPRQRQTRLLSDLAVRNPFPVRPELARNPPCVYGLPLAWGPRAAPSPGGGHEPAAPRDRHLPQLPRVLDDVRFALVVLRVQDLVRDPTSSEDAGELLGAFDRRRTDEERPPPAAAAAAGGRSSSGSSTARRRPPPRRPPSRCGRRDGSSLVTDSRDQS